MILEIETYKQDTRLTGHSVRYAELKRQIAEAESLYDRETDSFTALLCRLFQWTVIETDAQSDYVYDRDTKRLYRPIRAGETYGKK